MLDRELQYHMPFERLQKLSRTASRKAFSASWWRFWLLIALCFVLLAVLHVLDYEGRLAQATGIPPWVWLSLLGAFLFGGLVWIRRHGKRQMKARVDFDSAVRLRQDHGGLRFATPEIEYYLKWGGIGQMMVEPDGVVVSHGSMFFLIPNSAFADKAERDAFVRDVYGRLNEAAVERSEKFIRPLLGAAPSTTRI